jgi:dimethylglycine dehydrogenase
MELSTFAKFDVKGSDALSFLARICANRVPNKDGDIVLTHLLNENGYIDTEFTVTRLSPDHLYIVSAAAGQLHDMDQLRWRLRSDERVVISDVTDEVGVLVLAGPKSRQVLATCTDCDLANASFRWLTGREISVAGVAKVRALRVNYVGELGWELHAPMNQLPELFEALMIAGQDHHIALFGSYAMNSLRMEKAYRSWGAELTNEVTMIESDMERFVDFDKEFIGRTATLRSKQHGPRTKLVYLEVDAGDNDCYGNEPVYFGDKLIGITTSGAYGHAAKKSLAFAYVPPNLANTGEEFQVLIMGENRDARIIPQPAWDPKNSRIAQ